jgi:hypothetical protein
LEQHLAEKIHAYTRTYGDGKASSRVKDLVDIALVAVSLTVEAKKLKNGINEIFRQRGTHEAPPALPPPPSEWDRPWRELTADLPVPADVREGHLAAAGLVDPVLAGERSSGRWSPDLGAWQ